jgi:hypothetical protein
MQGNYVNLHVWHKYVNMQNINADIKKINQMGIWKIL